MHSARQPNVARLSTSRLVAYSVATLFPVLALGGFGLYSIRQDRASVERAAREEATRAVSQLIPRVRAQLGQWFTQNLDQAEQLRRDLLQGSRPAGKPTPSVVLAGEPPVESSAQILPWGISPPIRLSLAGELLDPRPYALVPEPPSWVGELTAPQLQALAAAERLSGDVRSFTAWSHFLELCPSAAKPQAELELLRCPSYPLGSPREKALQDLIDRKSVV